MLSFLKAIVGSGASEPLSLSNPPRAAQINTVSLGECEQEMLAWHSEPGTSQSPQNPEACREMASRALLVQSSANPAFALMRCKRRFHPWDCPCLQSIASRLEPIPVAWNNFTHFGESPTLFRRVEGPLASRQGFKFSIGYFAKLSTNSASESFEPAPTPFRSNETFQAIVRLLAPACDQERSFKIALPDTYPTATTYCPFLPVGARPLMHCGECPTV